MFSDHDSIDFKNTKVFKMSLGNTMENESDIYDYCIKNNVVSLGWKDVDFSDCVTREDFKKKDDTWGATALERFVKWMNIGDIKIISNSNNYFRAIAQVASDYYYDNNTPISHSHLEKLIGYILVRISIILKLMIKYFLNNQFMLIMMKRLKVLQHIIRI